MRSITFNEFHSMLHSVDIVENGVPTALSAESRLYVDFHSDRYHKTYKFIRPFLDEGNRSILDLGPVPCLSTLLQHLTGSQFTGVQGGHRLDNVKEEKRETVLETVYKGTKYSTPVHCGYDLESDRFPFADNSFDMVLFLEIIEHLIMDPIFTLKEIARVLKPDGILVLTTDNSHSFIKLMKFLTFKPIYWPYNDVTFGDRHNREYMKNEIELLLRGTGFKDVHAQRGLV